ncbi:MAG: alkaline phosphatase [Alphaproteobacteria bacterium]
MRMRFALTAGAASGALLAMAGTGLAQTLPVSDPYFQQGRDMLLATLAQQPNTNRARNVILFVGDGFGVSTLTATRIFEGQSQGLDGESYELPTDLFPYAALSRTYSHDGQVSDSAPTATAMMTGVKARNDVIGVTADVDVGDCAAALAHSVPTLLELAEIGGRSTGVVSTARITHATPAATYAHTPVRDWEADSDMPPEAIAAGCIDIASQLVGLPYGDGIDVALGGGRAMFIAAETADPEDEGKTGDRTDGRDLTAEWVDAGGAYVWNMAQFAALDPHGSERVLGLFNRSHMTYEADRATDVGGEPSIAEMTAFAIEKLSRNPDGFFLMVEGGRVDHASHEGNAYRTLTDAVAFEDAIRTAVGMVDLDETLIVVTADHSHTLTINGYPERGNPILGLAAFHGELLLGDDGLPYTTLSFANGPGAVQGGARADLTGVDTTDPDFVQQALVPMSSETHTGEDVSIHAIGPWAHLFQGVVEQNYIFHVMDFASGISGRALSN